MSRLFKIVLIAALSVFTSTRVAAGNADYSRVVLSQDAATAAVASGVHDGVAVGMAGLLKNSTKTLETVEKIPDLFTKTKSSKVIEFADATHQINVSAEKLHLLSLDEAKIIKQALQDEKSALAGETLLDAEKLSEAESAIDKLDAVIALKLAQGGSDWLVTLKSNTSFKSFLDNLIANPSTRKFTNVLAVEEEAVLKFYTTNDGYEYFNKALRGEIPMTDFYTAQKNLMNQALDKLPNYANQNELWRGLKNLSLNDVKAMYVKDAIVTEKHFMSSAYDVNDFITSSRARNFEYIIKIEGKNGKFIESISTAPEEAEVLFKSNTQFKVIEAEWDTHPDPDYLNNATYDLIWTIVLKEI